MNETGPVLMIHLLALMKHRKHWRKKAAWDFVRENPDIALTTINPGAVFGPPMDERYGTSLELVERLMSGEFSMAPPMMMPVVDVRDVAMMHVAAIELDAAKGERFSATSGTPTFLEMCKILSAWDPSLNVAKKEAPAWLLRIMGKFAPSVRAVANNIGRNLTVSGEKAQKTFGFKFIPVKDALIASAEAVKRYRN